MQQKECSEGNLYYKYKFILVWSIYTTHKTNKETKPGGRIQDSIYTNQLHFYMLAIKNLKIKLTNPLKQH